MELRIFCGSENCPWPCCGQILFFHYYLHSGIIPFVLPCPSLQFDSHPHHSVASRKKKPSTEHSHLVFFVSYNMSSFFYFHLTFKNMSALPNPKLACSLGGWIWRKSEWHFMLLYSKFFVVFFFCCFFFCQTFFPFWATGIRNKSSDEVLFSAQRLRGSVLVDCYNRTP